MEADNRISIILPEDWRADRTREKPDWCRVCKWDGLWDHILDRRNYPSTIVRITGAWPVLQISARAGCLCCAVLLAILQNAQSDGYTCIEIQRKHIILSENGGEMVQQMPIPYGLFAVSQQSPAPAGVHSSRLSLPLDTASESSLDWAQSQIENCIRTHPQCGLATGNFVPSRLVYIPPRPQHFGVILKVGVSFKRDSRYTALSHCWGSPDRRPACLTTAENINQQTVNIPWDRIPQTFQDAILFTQRLGVRYIWIDSICIIQALHSTDETASEDWKRESVQMHAIYSNAYITLAAASSPDCHGGFFTRRPDLNLSSHLLDVRIGDWGYSICALGEHPGSNVDPTSLAFCIAGLGQGSPFIVYPDPINYPLLQRAWAYQERLVSRRVLFFADDQLHWNCYGELKAEVGEYLTPKPPSVQYILKTEYALSFNHEQSTNKTETWHRLVETYSGLKLSVLTDRLPAIAAVAESLGQPDREYHAGIWGDSCHEDLLWRPSQREGPYPTTSTSPYVAPSWSWASHHSPILFSEFGEYFPISKIQLIPTASLDLIDRSQFGRVGKGSFLTVQGHVIDGCWEVSFKDHGRGREASPTRYFERKQSLTVLDQTVHFQPDYGEFGDQWAYTDGPSVKISLLLLALSWSGRAAALVLYRDSASGRYRRLGCWPYYNVNDLDKLTSDTFEDCGQLCTLVIE